MIIKAKDLTTGQIVCANDCDSNHKFTCLHCGIPLIPALTNSGFPYFEKSDLTDKHGNEYCTHTESSIVTHDTDLTTSDSFFGNAIAPKDWDKERNPKPPKAVALFNKKDLDPYKNVKVTSLAQIFKEKHLARGPHFSLWEKEQVDYFIVPEWHDIYFKRYNNRIEGFKVISARYMGMNTDTRELFFSIPTTISGEKKYIQLTAYVPDPVFFSEIIIPYFSIATDGGGIVDRYDYAYVWVLGDYVDNSAKCDSFKKAKNGCLYYKGANACKACLGRCDTYLTSTSQLYKVAYKEKEE